jgi:para-aminobenzoate synthetase/4-amino-4-deoxychorismate lyase
MAYLPPDETYVVLENSLDPEGTSWLYRNPARIIECRDAGELAASVAALHDAVSDGAFAAGLFSYEAGYILEPRLAAQAREPLDQPLMWFGLFDRRDRLSGTQLDSFWQDQCRGRHGSMGPFAASLSQSGYMDNIETIKDYLAAGDVYQVNYTFPMKSRVEGDPACIHAQLRQAQPVGWGAYIQTPDMTISSHSPEMFFEKRSDAFRLRPMKGTASRGRWPLEDEAHHQQLIEDAKSQAENLMIVDLERNDLSKLANPGSVSVPALFEAETYRSVIQMTSTVEGQVPATTPIGDIIMALFPCGSVTGAPKIRAMEIIRELETTPRGVYTGAIGHLTPMGDMAFNVPIRTITIDRQGQATMGIGSGIVADSDPQAEYEECALKAAFANLSEAPPSLIETLRWQMTKGYGLLDEHLARLQASAQYFGYPVDMDETRLALEHHAESLAGTGDAANKSWRVRLLCSPGGTVSIKSAPLKTPIADQAPLTVALSSRTIDSTDIYRFHKTTRRQLLDDAYATEAVSKGHLDVIMVNERGEICEGTRYNVFAEIDGVLYTPPIDCGLIPGCLRDSLIRRTDSPAHPRILLPEDLKAADQIYVGNSLSGLVAVKLF